MFKIAPQAGWAIGGKVIARETISALRKDVTAKCYGGDVSRNASYLRSRKKARSGMVQFGARRHSTKCFS